MPKKIGVLAKLKKLKIRVNIEKHKKKKLKKLAPPPPPPKLIPRGYKIVERYPLYEPFVHVAIGQNPKTGEYKYFLDELQLDTLERAITTESLTYFLQR